MVCASYDLCDNCNTAGIHEDHQMLKIEHPADALNVESYVSAGTYPIMSFFDLVTTP